MTRDKYKISIDGCDDSTIFEIELSRAEFHAIERLAQLAEATSEYGCEPTIEIERI